VIVTDHHEVACFEAEAVLSRALETVKR